MIKVAKEAFVALKNRMVDLDKENGLLKDKNVSLEKKASESISKQSNFEKSIAIAEKMANKNLINPGHNSIMKKAASLEKENDLDKYDGFIDKIVKQDKEDVVIKEASSSGNGGQKTFKQLKKEIFGNN